ncbi:MULTISPECIES: YwqG family protein [unclassified Exiguobacterium]|uniref:DUF1963 domain-containing protein n=1 Tax=unclassified Exiguobacterium TaxID=2644629 RepID=UPI001BE6FD86|nr:MULTISPECIES: YwqG family protein [unclassified Exiguobacterium]
MELKQVEQFIQKYELKNGEDILAALSKRVQLNFESNTNEEVAIGHSKFGGYPDLPNASMHPGENFTFLAQLRLSDLAEFDYLEELPKEGLLSFFYELDENPKMELDELHPWNVLYTEETDLERIKIGKTLEERHITFENGFGKKLSGLMGTMSDEAFGELYTILEQDELHVVGGTPDSIQMNVFEEARQRFGKRFNNPFLLLQVDHSEKLDIMFGDGGILYFVIPEDALRAKRFEEVQAILQCY